MQILPHDRGGQAVPCLPEAGQGQAAGAKAWVVKPFKPPQLLAAVEKLVLP